MTPKRRRLTVAAIVGSATCVIVGAVALRPTNSASRRVIIGHDAPTSTTYPPAAWNAPPTTLVEHTSPENGLGGRMLLVDTATGRTIRDVTAIDDAYLVLEMSVSRDSVFWEEFNRESFRVEQASIRDGAVHELGTYRRARAGGTPVPPWPLLAGVSPDGTRLWTHGDTIRNLADATETRIPPPPTGPKRAGSATSWLSDGHRLLAVDQLSQHYSETHYYVCAATDGLTWDADTKCPDEVTATTTTTTPQDREHGFAFDLRDPGRGWQNAAEPQLDGGWSGLQILGPGRLPSTVVAVAQPDEVGSTSRPHVLTVDVVSGAIVDDVEIPGDFVYSVDPSGTNVLFRAGERLERLSIADPRPVVIGPDPAGAAW
jgi:hypothetical protein